MKPNVATLTAALLLCVAEASFADRPLVIDDADPVDFKQFKVDGGAWYENDPGCKHCDFPFDVAAGVLPSLEINAGFGGQFEKRTEFDIKSGENDARSECGIDDLIIAAKWQFLKEMTWLPRQAIVPAVKFPTSDKNKGLGSGTTDYDFTWIASKSLCAKMGAHVNIGCTFVGKSADDDGDDILHYGVALDYRIVDLLQWVGEVYANKGLRSGTDDVVMFNTGLRWNPIDTLIVDCAAGSRLSGDAPDFTATAGLTWTFGLAKE